MKKKLLTLFIAIGMFAIGHSAFAATMDVYGYACSQNIGCFSLNSVSSAGQVGYTTPAQPASFKVQYDTVTNLFSGSAWSPTVGQIDFGQTCSPITPAITGTKCAKVLLATQNQSSAGGWGGVIDMQNVQVSSPGGSTFSGRGWEGWDVDSGGQTPSDVGVGWVDFSNASLAPTPTVTCGTANGQTVSTAPTTGLCSDSSTPTVSGPTGGQYTWTCGMNPNTVSCVATDSVTGGAPACDVTATTVPTNVVPTNLCAPGSTLLGSVTGNNPWSWTCKKGVNTIACSTVTIPPNGVPSCGTTAGTCLPSGAIASTVQPNGTWTCTDTSQFPNITITCGGSNPTSSVSTSPLKPVYKEN
ncbi:MAG: hypothetical protein WCG20_04125 [bacterium]